MQAILLLIGFAFAVEVILGGLVALASYAARVLGVSDEPKHSREG